MVNIGFSPEIKYFEFNFGEYVDLGQGWIIPQNIGNIPKVMCKTHVRIQAIIICYRNTSDIHPPEKNIFNSMTLCTIEIGISEKDNLFYKRD